MIVIIYPTTTANVREAVKALDENGLLKSFHTTLAFEEADCWLKLVPDSLRKQLLRRQFPCARNKIITYPSREIIKLLAKRVGWKWLTATESFAAPDTIGKELDSVVAKYVERNANSISAVFGYEDSCLLSFRTAKKYGIPRIYELTMTYWESTRAIIESACQRNPEWRATVNMTQSLSSLERKTEEVKLANFVLCISRFAYNSLPESVKVEASCRMVDYGCPKVHDANLNFSTRTDGKLRVLFVGALTLRKGIADLLGAMKILNRKDVQLVMLGELAAPITFYRSQFSDFEYHPPASHNEVLGLMSECDVFVFPSLCEGRGLVQLEALSIGLPVIGTPNATTDELIEDGVQGFIVPIGSPEAIAEKIAWFADHPTERKEMSRNAKLRAAAINWSNYRSQLISVIREICDTKTQ